MPMIWRGVSAANCGIKPLPIQILSFSGSDFGQNLRAIASLMTTAGGRAGDVAIRERAAADDRNLERLEVSRRHRQPTAASVKRAVRQRTAHHDERQSVPSFERHAARRRGGDHSGNAAQPLHPVPHQLVHRRGLRVLRPVERHPHRQHIFGVEARLHGRERHRSANQERRTDQQHHRERNFGDHQDGPRLVLAEARSRRVRRSL